MRATSLGVSLPLQLFPPAELAIISDSERGVIVCDIRAQLS